MKLKYWTMIFLTVLISCNHNHPPFDNKNLTKLDSAILLAIENKYTEQNQLEGTEYATIETLRLKNILYDFKDSTCFATYHIHVSYSPMVLPPGYERPAPPPLILDKTSQVIKTKDGWKMIE